MKMEELKILQKKALKSGNMQELNEINKQLFAIREQARKKREKARELEEEKREEMRLKRYLEIAR